jgi:hypothetical protein
VTCKIAGCRKKALVQNGIYARLCAVHQQDAADRRKARRTVEQSDARLREVLDDPKVRRVYERLVEDARARVMQEFDVYLAGRLAERLTS